MKEDMKIIIADDFPVLVEDLKETIDAVPNMKVVGTATSGSEAVCIAKDVPFDLFLMDIEMEHSHAGITAAEKIRETDPQAKIIFLTAHETKEIILTAMGTGALDYMVKGLEENEIIEHIRNAYYGKPMLDSKIQMMVFTEYQRLQKSEQGLLYFIQNISNLTPTEKELIAYLLEGKKVKEIANLRSVELVTIKSQINKLLKKFEMSRTKEIVKIIKELNLKHLFLNILNK